MEIDLNAPQIVEWLAQFEIDDQPNAAKLLSEILTVSADDMNNGLRAVILEIADNCDGPVALYAERHIRKHHKSGPNRMFKESRSKPKRAYGNGPPPVPQGRAYARETGSEGLVATLISGLVRAAPARFLDHPGPDQIRKNKARLFVVVTDFVGSGKRATDNLEAAWKVHSFKSWRSSRHMRFAVAAYSGTERGVAKVRSHRSLPSLHLHRGCPIISNLDKETRLKVIDLCDRYGPRNRQADRTSLGYGNAGSLIVFDHGMPNNAPLLLHTTAPGWTPLFPRRSASLLGDARRETIRKEEIRRSLMRLREKRLSVAPRFAGIEEGEQNNILVLTALKKRPRNRIALSSRTGLTLSEVEEVVRRARQNGYLDEELRPTQRAYEAFNYLRTSDTPSPPLPKTNNKFYCPKSLRSPQRAFG